MSCPPRILIVDESAESRDVLRTLLERRGATAIEASRPEDAVELAQVHQPQLIVLDAESDHSRRQIASTQLRAAATRSDVPIVILGTLSQRGPLPEGQFLAKPYHYGQLLRKIDELLAAA